MEQTIGYAVPDSAPQTPEEERRVQEMLHHCRGASPGRAMAFQQCYAVMMGGRNPLVEIDELRREAWRNYYAALRTQE